MSSNQTFRDAQPQTDPCTLFALTQYQCTPSSSKVTCWPIERIFRQCGAHNPAIEVTNHVNRDDGQVKVEQKFIDNPPKGRNWADLR